jgi:undecaprenyl diphosphate synthase
MESVLPQCLGFIMDGNRRYATERGEDTLAGHLAGRETFGQIVRYVRDAGIPHAVFYAFSTENWQRSEREVAYLMDLFHGWLARMDEQVDEDKVRVRIVGRRSDFSPALQDLMHQLETKSADYTATTIWVALSYGGRPELLDAINRAIALGSPVTEESFSELLWTAGMPDPDMIVRTGGEQRLSNFLPWQSVYSELYFIPTYWPALTKHDFDAILHEYANRQRRHGI